MDAKKFANMLRSVVKEAVRDVVRNELRQVIREEMTGKPITETKRTQFSAPASTKHKSKPAKQFVKDPLLNDILNETQGFSMAEAYGTGTGMPSLGMDIDEMSFDVSQPSALQGINGEVVEVNNEQTQAVVEAMTRDYSELMKAINAKKGN